MTNIADAVTYGRNEDDEIADKYIHTIRIYTGVDRYHDFKSKLTTAVSNAYDRYVYEQDPLDDLVYQWAKDNFNAPSNVENKFLSNIIGNYEPPISTGQTIPTIHLDSELPPPPPTAAHSVPHLPLDLDDEPVPAPVHEASDEDLMDEEEASGVKKKSSAKDTKKYYGKKALPKETKAPKTSSSKSKSPKTSSSKAKASSTVESSPSTSKTSKKKTKKYTSIYTAKLKSKAKAKSKSKAKKPVVEEMETGNISHSFSAIDPDRFWVLFRPIIPEYDGTNPTPNHMYIKTKTIARPADGTPGSPGYYPGYPSVDLNQYIVSKVRMDAETNIGDSPANSFNKRFFDVIDFHAKVKDAFSRNTKQEFRTRMTQEAPHPPVSICVDTDQALLPRLLYYDNALLTDEQITSIELAPLPPGGRTINYIVTRETVHDPAEKASPFTVTEMKSHFTRSTGNIMNTFVETPYTGNVVDNVRDDAPDTEVFGPLVDPVSGLTFEALPTYQYPHLSQYLQGKYSSIRISDIFLTPRDDTAIQTVDFMVKAQVRNNEVGIPGKINYYGKDNRIPDVVHKLNNMANTPDEFMGKKMNLIVSKRYGDQLQAYICKNDARILKSKSFTRVSQLRSIPHAGIPTIVNNPNNVYRFDDPAAVHNEDLGVLYLATGDRPLSGYCLLTGVNFYYTGTETGNGKFAYIFTHVRMLQPGKTYVGGTRTIQDNSSFMNITPDNLSKNSGKYPIMSENKKDDFLISEISKEGKVTGNEYGKKEKSSYESFEKMSPKVDPKLSIWDLMVIPTVTSPNYETDKINTRIILNHIFQSHSSIEVDSIMTNPLTSIYIILSALYRSIELDYEEEEEISDEHYIYIYRLKHVVNLIMNYCKYDSKRMDIGGYITLVYEVGLLMSFMLITSLYSHVEMEALMELHSGASCFEYFMTTSTYLTIYFDKLIRRNQPTDSKYTKYIISLIKKHNQFSKNVFKSLTSLPVRVIDEYNNHKYILKSVSDMIEFSKRTLKKYSNFIYEKRKIDNPLTIELLSKLGMESPKGNGKGKGKNMKKTRKNKKNKNNKTKKANRRV
jgi:hypothetical protein